ncbi:phosphoribosylformylglycinamidine synthase subunit PurS [Methanosphaerula palustris]|uniref:Phosphoribosylformylglycinamidine synthase subunit PurS n=1 Tax=Methanosphaerula palustris (strain ATCC BAA-1556 / DSM 19958 / E1-9c) TaxID=521011 RepID=B8GGS4_METPE|nr:phosphoribosylformylglycinamidine synthase subunit PurS [Methanosphaerula palustris]ACL16329.1 phosphoribosylformylglycinamidine synthase, purS [Methanosphaerula palustris E1-9c]
MKFTATITIALKPGMLDPEARAIQQALGSIGHPTESLSTARLFRLTIEAKDREEALQQATASCERLLANPVIHTYVVEVA